jgi:hypothetical protein
VLPAAVSIGVDAVKGASLVAAIQQWLRHLFEPGYNEFLLCMINGAPFLVLAVFTRIHLASEKPRQRRSGGITGGLVAGSGFLVYGLAGIRSSRSSTAAIGYLFLPFFIAVVIPIGYVAGRLFARVRARLCRSA